MDASLNRLQLHFFAGAISAFLLVFIVAVIVRLGFFNTFDYFILLSINSLANESFASIVVFYTEFGGEILWIILIPILYILGKTSGRKSAIMMGVAIVLGTLIEMIIGYMYYRPRPYLVLNNLNLFFQPLSQGPSFPSGHTVRAFAGALAFSYHYKRWSYIMLPIALAVGLSRIYLAVHYPSDVIGGAIVGLGSFFIAVLIINKLRARNKAK